MLLVWEKCDYTFPAGFITTFGDQEICGRVAIVNGRTKQTPSAIALLGIVGGGRGGRGGKQAGGREGLAGWGEGGSSGEHQEMCRTVCNV